MNTYLIIDVGTGNVRVALVSSTGKILNIKRDDVRYEQDDHYSEALYFDPDILWDQIITLGKKVVRNNEDASIRGITASSQREGIVLLDEKGKALIGLPNHDHRGRQWENTVKNKDQIYELTGRYPASLFSALKLRGIKEKRSGIWQQFHSFLSISDWVQYQLTGVARYEHSQASETQLYSTKDKSWSKELAAGFDLTIDRFPELISAGTVLGYVLPQYADQWKITTDVAVIVGGADTQLAMKSTQPETGDIVIVSGTTTPVTKIIDDYHVDCKQRTWTNRDIEDGRFVLETNSGVTGLNYQRLKEIFYPDEDYATIEKELTGIDHPPRCIASLGSLIAKEKAPIVRGGFVFDVPVSHQLNRADFVWAALWDIACSIKENYDILCELSSHDSDYVWACGGGMQSRMLRQFISGLIGKELRIRRGYRQASVSGAALLCREVLEKKAPAEEKEVERVVPEDRKRALEWYEKWKSGRNKWKQFSNEN